MFQTPFQIYISDKREFLNKLCSVCLCTLFYPEDPENNVFVRCVKLNCNHIYHNDCIHKILNHNHLNCPECRTPINQIINLDVSLELTIRNDAFDNGNVEPCLIKQFENESLKIADYPYHKIVFERWRNMKLMLLQDK